MKKSLKRIAIQLRREGYSYSEIIKKVPVAKSTLSLWLRSVNLTNSQKQKLTLKKLKSAKRGAEKRRLERIMKTREIIEKSILDIKNISKEELFLIGVVLYGEGSKEKNYSSGVSVIFSNSDPLMCRLFLRWLKEIVGIEEKRISFEIYIHDNFKDKVSAISEYWARETGFSISKFGKIYFKKSKTLTLRKNIAEGYHGLLRIRVRRSTDLNRKIKGWFYGICIRCGVV